MGRPVQTSPSPSPSPSPSVGAGAGTGAVSSSLLVLLFFFSTHAQSRMCPFLAGSPCRTCLACREDVLLAYLARA